MSRVQYKNWAVDSAGDVVGSTAFEVRVTSTGDLATIYTSATGSTEADNPGVAEVGGNFTFFADPDLYTITIGSSPSDETVPWDAVSAKDQKFFASRESRSALVTAISNGEFDGAQDGSLLTAGGFVWIKDGGSGIPDMPGYSPPSDYITPQHFGAVPDGDLDILSKMDAATDNTAAFEAMFAYSDRGSALQETHYVIPHGVYAVTRISIQNKTRFTITAHNAVLYGIATSTQTELFHMHNVNRFRQLGQLRLYSDGQRGTYNTNYACALRFTSNTTNDPGSPYPNGNSPTSEHFWEGLEVNQFEYGVVSGYDEGSVTPHHREAQDSINFSNTYFRSVMKPIYQNVDNSGMQFHNVGFYVQQFSASSSWWDYSDTYFFNNENGRLIIDGGVAQKANALGFAFYGKDFNVNGLSYECSAPSYILGSSEVRGIDRGFCVGQTEAIFIVDDAAEGELHIADCEYRRITTGNKESDIPTNAPINFVECANNPDFKITILDSNLTEFYFEPLQATTNQQFVLGGDLTISNVVLDNTSAYQSWHFRDDSKLFIGVADTEGESMSTTPDLSAKGGWIAYGLSGGNFEKITADLPSGAISAIALESVGSSGGISTASSTGGFKIRARTDYVLSFDYKRISGAGDVQILMRYSDYAGNTLGVATQVWRRDGTKTTDDGLDDWNRVNVPIKVPAGAHFGQIFFQTTTSAVRAAFTGLN